MAVIELEGQGTRALTHESNSRMIVIGRDPSADFQIPLTTVSRQHVRIGETDGVYVLEDLGSTHGTLLNGKKMSKGEKKVLRTGDIIELTKAKITCTIELEKVAAVDPSEGTQAIAAKAVQGILGRLGDAEGEGPYLRVIAGNDEGTRFKFGSTGSEWALGRSKDCEFVLNDPNVSRRHAVVKKDWNGFTVMDLGSKNGVIVNDKKIGKPRRLKDRDEVVIGPVKLIFVDPDAELMAALADVPGFQADEPEEPEPLERDPSQLGAPGDGVEGGEQPLGEVPGPGDVPGAEPMPESAGSMAAAPEAAPDEYADIDPGLLDENEGKGMTIEWVLVAVAGLIALGCVVLLLAIL